MTVKSASELLSLFHFCYLCDLHETCAGHNEWLQPLNPLYWFSCKRTGRDSKLKRCWRESGAAVCLDDCYLYTRIKINHNAHLQRRAFDSWPFVLQALQLFRLNKRDKGQVLSAHNSSQCARRVTIAADIYRRQVNAGGAPNRGDKPDQ